MADAARDFAGRRDEMVAVQIEARGLKDARVLAAMRRVPRHLFVPPELRGRAYDDEPLPIGDGQTISQPYIVAYMTEALSLRGQERVLEIGTGSGYQTAVLAELAREIHTVELVAGLSLRAQSLLEELGYANIRFRVGDGTFGWAEHSPYDAIIVTAAAPTMPAPLASPARGRRQDDHPGRVGISGARPRPARQKRFQQDRASAGPLRPPDLDVIEAPARSGVKNIQQPEADHEKEPGHSRGAGPGLLRRGWGGKR